MVWARIDDCILDNRKIAKAGVFGFAVHVAGIVWCCRNESDGNIPYARVTSLLSLDRVMFDVDNPLALPDGDDSDGGGRGLDPYVVADHLVTIGLWHRTKTGYEIHDFLKYNPSHEQLKKKREGNRKSQANVRSGKKVDVLSSDDIADTFLSPDPDPVSKIPPTPAREGPGTKATQVPAPSPGVLPDARHVKISDAITDEQIEIASMATVQDHVPAWLKFTGKQAGKWLDSVNGEWQSFCVTFAKYERADRERDRDMAQRRGQAAPGAPTGVQYDGPVQKAERARRRADHEQSKREASPAPIGALLATVGERAARASPDERPSETRAKAAPARPEIAQEMTEAEREAKRAADLRWLAEQNAQQGREAS